MEDPFAIRREHALRVAVRMAMESDDPELAEFAREVHSGRHTLRELLCSSAYDEMMRRQLGPMVESWSAMSEMDRERAAADADDAEWHLIEAFELADEADRPEPATAGVDEADEDVLFRGFGTGIDAADRGW